MPEPLLSPNQSIRGFTVTRVTPLPNLRATAYQLTHAKTGARLLHIHNADSENLFSITFKTPPTDDTGLPHILEHSVLAGSRKYPVKEPFFEMVKSSMATFINAMTGADVTMYPVSSTVKQDFYNLAEVYCDAVFHPLLTENTFKREGHHLEFATRGDPSSALTIKGIVYNEMKGYYSRADRVAGSLPFQWLFPDTHYSKDSGGNPQFIPDLTYAQFKAFHENYYHPSNAYIFLCGDIPTTEHLAFLQPRLDEFSPRTIDATLHRQPRWKEAQARNESYAIGKDEETARKTYFVTTWVVGDVEDGLDVMRWAILDRVLFGNQGAPLRKALIDSKLGQDTFDCGFSASAQETVFSAGLKGAELENHAAFNTLLFNQLKEIAATGITKERVDAAFQQVAYNYLEIGSGFPMTLMYRSLMTWVDGGDPLMYLRAGELLEKLKANYAADPTIFSRLITEKLLNNPHRITCAFPPDRALAAREEAAFAEKMAALKATLSQEKLQKIAATVEELDLLQNTPNSPEALASLPQLKAKDLPRKPKHIPTAVEKIAGIELLRNDVFANGVNYLQININLAGLDPSLYPYLPLFGDVIRKMGAGNLDFAAMAQRVASHTGGLSFWTAASSHATQSDNFLRFGRFGTKFLDDRAQPALAVLEDFLFRANPADSSRLRDILNQNKAANRSRILDSGVEIARLNAGRGISIDGALAYQMHGVPAIKQIDFLADNFDAEFDGIIQKLQAIRDFMHNSRRFTVSFTGSNQPYELLKSTLTRWAGQMKSDPIVDRPILFAPHTGTREGLAAPVQVSYCAQIFPAPHQSHPDYALLLIGGGYLGRGYLLEEIRFKGTAYGGGGAYGGASKSWQLFSYMDPNISRTLKVFDGLLDHVRSAHWSETAIDHAIIYQAKEGERPIRPAEATDAALSRHVFGYTRERREEIFTNMLAATPATVKKAVIAVLESNLSKSSVAVVSSRTKLEAANTEGANLAIEDVLK